MTDPVQPDYQAHLNPQGRLPVEFTGKSGEYFKIWIVNVLFSILTLGIYSAWAKVRTNQYFHGHTSIGGHRFRYLAKPLQILKGRLIAVAVFIAYSAISAFSLYASVALTIAFLFFIPLASRAGGKIWIASNELSQCAF